MSGQSWYRHNPRDFLDGVVGMSPDMIGAYIVCLNLIYARGGPIPFEPRWLSGCMGCSTRQATALVQRLIDAGKLTDIGGQLTNERAASELQDQAERSAKLAENGAKGGRKLGERFANQNETPAKNEADVAKTKTWPKPGSSIREEKRVDKKEIANAISSACVSDTGFDDFWKAYPKRVAKEGARKAWAAAVKRGVSPEHIAAAARRYAEHPPDEARFIPNPQTWLNGGRYDDEQMETRNGNGMGRHNGQSGGFGGRGPSRIEAIAAVVAAATQAPSACGERGSDSQTWGGNVAVFPR